MAELAALQRAIDVGITALLNWAVYCLLWLVFAVLFAAAPLAVGLSTHLTHSLPAGGAAAAACGAAVAQLAIIFACKVYRLWRSNSGGVE